MNLLQLKYFTVLAETLSFREASEALFISQPNLSIQISALEKEWGMVLFERRYRSVALTPAGEVMNKALRQANLDLRNALEKAQNIANKEITTVIIGLPEGARMGNLPMMLGEFQNSHPGISILTETQPQAQLLLNSTSSKYDLVINQTFMLENENELLTTLLATRNYTLTISRNHPAIQGIPDPTIQDLSSCSIKAYIPSCNSPTRLIERAKFIWSQEGFFPEEIILVPNVDSTLWAASMCIGVAMLDDTILLPDDLNLMFFKSDITMPLVIARRKDNEKEYLDELIRFITQETDLDFTAK